MPTLEETVKLLAEENRIGFEQLRKSQEKSDEGFEKMRKRQENLDEGFEKMQKGIDDLRKSHKKMANAAKAGLFTILAAGSSASITNPTDFKPKEF